VELDAIEEASRQLLSGWKAGALRKVARSRGTVHGSGTAVRWR
jgi:hypothetical protein